MHFLCVFASSLVLWQVLVEKRISPWINKKIVEYIGEEEPALTEFIINSVSRVWTIQALCLC